ncbi:MAG TPA: hypothetical protein VEU72_02915 [Nitrosopumilaceae archaeon]|nr:hypothetical protein [Nitrosopumilaceae archaeon]
MESGQPSITKLERPLGISVLGVLGIIGGISASLIGLLLVVLLPFIANLNNNLGGNSTLFSGPFSYAYGGFLVAGGVTSFIISIGMLRGSKWAWKGEIVFILLGLAIDTILNFWEDPISSNIGGIVFGACIDALIIYYFYRPRVKSYFGIGTPTTVP